jgi:hypothetical protein
MATYDRPSDLQSSFDANARMTGGGMSPPLADQTPGLDTTARVRNLAMRPVSWARERPDIAFSILGGIAVIGIGTWLAMRSRKMSRLEQIQCKAEEMYGWLRSKV